MITDLFSRLKEQNIHIEVKDNNLDVKAPSGVLTKDIIDEIKAHKKELIDFISKYSSQEITVIQKVEKQSQYQLSSSQIRIWAMCQSEEGNVAYNSIGGYVFEGDLNIEYLNEALQKVIHRHESLRTVFRENEKGEVFQLIKEVEAFDIVVEQEDLRNDKNAEETLNKDVKRESLLPFDLSNGPMLKTKLYQLEDAKWVFVYTIHHIIIDAWSMKVFISEILEFYNALKENRAHNLAPLRIQYKDYANYESQLLSGETYEELKSYWLKEFEGEVPVLNMPSDKKRPVIQTFNGASLDKVFDEKLTIKIEKLIKQSGATMFMGLTAMMNALFYKFSGQEDFVIGTPITGREHTDLHNQIGYYGNTLAIRMQFAKEDSFFEVLNQVKKQVLGAYEHQMFPFATLVKELQLKRDLSRNPLFDVQVIYGENENGKDQERLEGLEVTSYEFEEKLKTSRFDIVFSFYKENNCLALNVQYNIDVFSEELVQQITDHIEVIMSSIINDPDQRIEHLEYINADHKKAAIEISKGRSLPYDKAKTILDLFADQVEKQPDAIAVVYQNTILTYRQLDEKSTQLANYLLNNYDLKENDLVGLMINNSEDVLVSILGIQKTGAAYVPIDPTYPKERIKHIVKDASPKVLLTQSDYLFELDYYDGGIFAVDVQMEMIAGESLEKKNKLTPNNLAYVIYTSGSTGTSKGVLIDHKNLMHSTVARLETYKNVESFLLLSSISFDSSIAGIFGTIASGGKLVITSKLGGTAVDTIADLIYAEKVTHILTVPSYYKLLIEEVGNKQNTLKAVIVAGEECSKSLVALHYDANYLKDCLLYNEYGPTEGTVWCSYYCYTSDKEFIPSIGKPIANTSMYILNQNSSELVPYGVTGEICIAGNGVSQGYLNKPSLTQEKFIDNPFEPGTKLYRTGDLGKKYEDGNIAFLGRKDNQIKIRGYRLELGEVENSILDFEKIQGAIVLYENETLQAYIQTENDIKKEDLKDYLKTRLPLHAIPNDFIFLSEFPLLPNGKVDKNQLTNEAINRNERKINYIAPTGNKEQTLVAVFEEVLGKENISMQDDFFALGGDSIKAIQIISRLKQKGYTLTVQDIMQQATIQDMAERAENAALIIDQSQLIGIVPLTPIQQYFFENTTKGTHHYNQSVLLQSSTSISAEALEQVFHKMILHHDALRAFFYKKDDKWIQEIKNEAIAFQVQECKYDQHNFAAQCEQYQSSFDLENGPLFQAVLFRGETSNYLLLIAHHLVIDGVSWRIILEDLQTLYTQFSNGENLELPLKTHSLQYWQEKQLQYANSKQLEEEEKYWKSIQQATSSKTLELPRDYAFEGINCYGDFETEMFQLSVELTENLLTKSNQAYKTTINDVLITALGNALEVVFDKNEFVLQLEGHGRENIEEGIDITRTVGWFTTIYPVYLSMKNKDNDIDRLIEVKETLHRIPNHGIGYGILKYIKNSTLNVLPDISFNYLGDFDSGRTDADSAIFQFSGLDKGKDIDASTERTGSIDITGILVQGKLQIMVSYNKNYFSNTTIREFKNIYNQKLESLIHHLSGTEEGHLTPVDLTFKGLSMESLEALANSI